VLAFTPVHTLFHRFRSPVLALAIGGIVLGLLGVLGGPLTLFKRLDEMKELATGPTPSPGTRSSSWPSSRSSRSSSPRACWEPSWWWPATAGSPCSWRPRPSVPPALVAVAPDFAEVTPCSRAALPVEKWSTV
jgi:hypothetical protein